MKIFCKTMENTKYIDIDVSYGIQLFPVVDVLELSASSKRGKRRKSKIKVRTEPWGEVNNNLSKDEVLNHKIPEKFVNAIVKNTDVLTIKNDVELSYFATFCKNLVLYIQDDIQTDSVKLKFETEYSGKSTETCYISFKTIPNDKNKVINYYVTVRLSAHIFKDNKNTTISFNDLDDNDDVFYVENDEVVELKCKQFRNAREEHRKYLNGIFMTSTRIVEPILMITDETGQQKYKTYRDVLEAFKAIVLRETKLAEN